MELFEPICSRRINFPFLRQAQIKRAPSHFTLEEGPERPLKNAKANGALCRRIVTVKTKDTEPFTRLFNNKFPVYLETFENSVLINF